VTRRHFAALPAAAALAQDASAPLTAKQVLEKIRQNLGVEWREPTVDTIKAGNPDAPVKGIATTVMATLDVLQRAAAQGKNLVITHEPTFYNHEDKTQDFEKDPVYLAKQELIAKNNMVVFRFHDNWHAHRPDQVLTGLAQVLGFTRSASNPRLFEIPTTTLDKLARDIKSRLKANTMRVLGKPDTKITFIALNPGYANLMGPVRALAQADVFIAGEAREWEGVEYAFDAVAAGQNKALILLGHAISEDPGMEECAKWLKTFLPAMPIEFIPAGDPFWRP
jgi:putative NIF3 family GTP cyclohydrolase 1 type 2